MVHKLSSSLSPVKGGVFAQRGHSANHYVVYPGTTPENHPPTGACMIHSKQHWGCRIQDPGTRGKHQTKTKHPWCTWCTSRGCRVQNLGPCHGHRGWKTADLSHSAGTAHGAPPRTSISSAHRTPLQWRTAAVRGEYLPGARPACPRGATFALSILSLAPSLSSPREVPQVDRTGPQTFPARHVA